jgi:hypothetical protein
VKSTPSQGIEHRRHTVSCITICVLESLLTRALSRVLSIHEMNVHNRQTMPSKAFTAFLNTVVPYGSNP